MWTKNYEVKFVVCQRCGAYMIISHVSVNKHGYIITYICNCGYTLDLVSRQQNKKDGK